MDEKVTVDIEYWVDSSKNRKWKVTVYDLGCDITVATHAVEGLKKALASITKLEEEEVNG